MNKTIERISPAAALAVTPAELLALPPRHSRARGLLDAWRAEVKDGSEAQIGEVLARAVEAVEARGVICRRGEFRVRFERPAKGWTRKIGDGKLAGAELMLDLAIPLAPIVAVERVTAGGNDVAGWKGTAEISPPPGVKDATIEVQVLAGFDDVPHLVKEALAMQCLAMIRNEAAFTASAASWIKTCLSPYLPRVQRGEG